MILRILLCCICLIFTAAPLAAQDSADAQQDYVPEIQQLEVPEDGTAAENDGSQAIIPEQEDLETTQNSAEKDVQQTQEPVGGSRIGNEVYDRLPAEIQDEIMEEAEYVYDRCERNSMYRSFYDCRCLAVKFTDARIEKGPEKKPLVLAEEYAEECVNQPGIAGFAWEQCQGIAFNMEYGRDDYCKCFANTYVKEFIDRPVANSIRMKNVMAKALVECDDGNGPIKGEW